MSGEGGDGGEGVMNVTMPTVGWHRQFGGSNISADISRTMFNSFTLGTGEQRRWSYEGHVTVV